MSMAEDIEACTNAKTLMTELETSNGRSSKVEIRMFVLRCAYVGNPRSKLM